MRLAVIVAGLLAVITSAVRAETFEAGGGARTYSVIIPKTTPAPLVLVLHGNNRVLAAQHAKKQMPGNGFDEVKCRVLPPDIHTAIGVAREVFEKK